MANSTLIGKIHMDCPLCHMFHEVEERTRMTSTFMKGERVFYEEHFYVCKNDGKNNQKPGSVQQENSNQNYVSQNSANHQNEIDKSRHQENGVFQTESLINSNQMEIRNAYRKGHNLLTSDEIVSVRENYGLTQVEAAKLLGWGEATIARYESKAIQDEAYDTMLRIIKENPLRAILFLDKNSDKFPERKRMQIRTKMVERLDSYGKEFLSRQVLVSEYVKFSVPSDFNGYKLLDIDKVEYIVSYYAERIADLYKIQLMNLLWYADVLYFKTYSNSMTGLVYRHEPMGVLPVGHNSLMNLKNMNVREECEYESTKYRFYPNSALDTSELSRNETSILDSIIAKLRSFNSSDLVEYVHEETAYKQTTQGEIIPYSHAKKIQVF